jgi:hypothetical protein
VGHEDLLKLLRKEKISDDPALQSQSNKQNFLYHSMCLFVLQNTRELLRAEDAAFLLERERWERDCPRTRILHPLISAWWAIAAADLDSENTRAMLKAAWSRFGESHQQEDR